MGFDSIWHWLILLVVVLVIFGTGKLTNIGPDIGKAVREFKKAMRGDDDKATAGDDTLKADPPAQATTADATQKQEQHDAGQSK